MRISSFYVGYCKKLTTEHTEKIFYFKRITDILLPPLCVLSIIVLFFPCFCSSKIYQISPSSSSSPKNSVPIPSYAIKKHTIYRLFPLKNIPLENTENSSGIPNSRRDSGLWFHIVPLFFIELLTVSCVAVLLLPVEAAIQASGFITDLYIFYNPSRSQ